MDAVRGIGNTSPVTNRPAWSCAGLERRLAEIGKSVSSAATLRVGFLENATSRWYDGGIVAINQVGAPSRNQPPRPFFRDVTKQKQLSSVRHPSFLRFLKQITNQIHSAGKWVGMCGEMAADRRNLPLLLGLRLDRTRRFPRPKFMRPNERLRSSAPGMVLAFLVVAIRCRTVAEVNARRRGNLTNRSLCSVRIWSCWKTQANERRGNAGDGGRVLHLWPHSGPPTFRGSSLGAGGGIFHGLGYGFATPHCKTEAVTAG